MATETFTLKSFAEQIAEELETPKGKTLDACKAAFEAMAKHVGNGGQATIHAFGTFKLTERKARLGRNPATGESIQIPAKKVFVFKAAKAVKDAANTAKPAKKTAAKKK